jgi:enediyne biosynthesis protein E5
MKPISIKHQLVIFLVLLASGILFIDKDAHFLPVLFIAVISAAGVDAGFAYLKQKKLVITSSSLISGLIVGFVLASGQPAWIICLASVVAVGSKHLIRLRGRHIFNPAALGIFTVIILLNATTQWRGTYLWYCLAPAGLYFSYKIRKLEIISSYFIASLILFGGQALMQKVNPLHAFGYLSYFYIFVMIIEPKTTPVNFLGKIIFGTLLAAVIFVFTQAGVKFDAELSSLLILNATVPVLNKLSLAKKGGWL